MLVELYSGVQGCTMVRCLPRAEVPQKSPRDQQKLLHIVQHPRVPDLAPGLTGTLLLPLHGHGATERAQSRLQIHTNNNNDNSNARKMPAVGYTGPQANRRDDRIAKVWQSGPFN